MKRNTLFALLVFVMSNVFAQKNPTTASYFENPLLIDSSSTVIIPTRYNSEFFSNNKIAYWGDILANVIFYNFKTDTSKKLFEQDTYILSFINRSYKYDNATKHTVNNNTSKYLFYKVKNVDYNKNGRIDNADPAILYVSDFYGNNLKALTNSNENVVAIDFFEMQNFALLKIQRDQNNDLDFENSDKDFYMVKLDLNTLVLGNHIELK